ncbi:MAG: hypothetical protein ACOY5U_04510 [Pseudomonadota bacterium]
MTLDRIVTMVVNAVIRRVVNLDVGRAFAAFGRRTPPGPDAPPSGPVDPRAAAEARAAAKRARQTARLLRRMR